MDLNFTNRTCSFDSGHRVMYNASKCKSWHGHTYLLDSVFSYSENTTGESIGYAIDFGEIKRVFIGFIMEYIDHGSIVNPIDPILPILKEDKNNKIYVMSLGNPSAENIAKELFYIGQNLLKERGLNMHKIKLNETPNCYVECLGLNHEEYILMANNKLLNDLIKSWISDIGIKEYDSRKIIKKEE